MRLVVVLLALATSVSAFVAYRQNKELGYCIQLIDPSVSAVPVE